MPDPRALRFDRAHSLLGVFPLAVFVGAHIVHVSSALDGRVAWVAQVVQGRPGAALGAGLALALGAHAWLGVRRLRARAQGAAGPQARGLSRVQLVTGLVAAAFIAYHTMHLWPEPVGPHTDPASSYDRLFATLGRWPHLGAYVVGVTALCFHIGHGLARLPFSWGMEVRPGRWLGARLLGGAAGFVLWLLALDVVGYFANGEGLWPRVGVEAPPPPE